MKSLGDPLNELRTRVSEHTTVIFEIKSHLCQVFARFRILPMLWEMWPANSRMRNKPNGLVTHAVRSYLNTIFFKKYFTTLEII
ncbi:hypothetical protein BpHYR1_050335 [Brachionus plicatilis]|uniref:Uncharacterized protein n=1 Tax=Brachionus plicatilis TaxID=10195 RepID=A0A3M7PDV1_BRAPC|nr:hypothetical protein BpHYR1_050335 [Brachionus plicatilis]